MIKQINVESFNPSDPIVNMTIRSDKPSVRSLGDIIPLENYLAFITEFFSLKINTSLLIMAIHFIFHMHIFRFFIFILIKLASRIYIK